MPQIQYRLYYKEEFLAAVPESRENFSLWSFLGNPEAGNLSRSDSVQYCLLFLQKGIYNPKRRGQLFSDVLQATSQREKGICICAEKKIHPPCCRDNSAWLLCAHLAFFTKAEQIQGNENRKP